MTTPESLQEEYKGFIIREKDIYGEFVSKSAKKHGSIEVRKPLKSGAHQLMKAFSFTTSNPEKREEALYKAKRLINSLT